MTAPTIRKLMIDVIASADCGCHKGDGGPWNKRRADALLASPELAAMFDLAVSGWSLYDAKTRGLYPELGALCESWRVSRAERPTP